MSVQYDIEYMFSHVRLLAILYSRIPKDISISAFFFCLLQHVSLSVEKQYVLYTAGSRSLLLN